MKKHRIHLLFTSLGMAAFLAASTTNAEQKPEQQPKPTANQSQGPDTDFIKGAHQANLVELQAAKLAQTKGRHPAVVQLGEVITKDHEKIKQRLQTLVEKRQLKLDDQLSPQHSEELQNLRLSNGSDFDRAFLAYLIQDHQRDLKMLEEKKGQLGQNSEMKALIDEKLPMVRRHLEMAEAAFQNFRSARQVSSVDVDNRNLELERGDGEVLGLPTSNKDGTILGVLPAPSRTVESGSKRAYVAEELADGKVDKNVDNIYQADRDAVGASPRGEANQRAGKVRSQAVPERVLNVVEKRGLTGARITPITAYKAEVNGKTYLFSQDGALLNRPSADLD